VTHPFHPRFGREHELVVRRQNWGEDRVCVRDEHGEVRSLPTAWTDMVAADPFVVMAAGRCPFRVTDLLELADLGGAAALRGRSSVIRVKQITPLLSG
jgi:hypothetical protein